MLKELRGQLDKKQSQTSLESYVAKSKSQFDMHSKTTLKKLQDAQLLQKISKPNSGLSPHDLTKLNSSYTKHKGNSRSRNPHMQIHDGEVGKGVRTTADALNQYINTFDTRD